MSDFVYRYEFSSDVNLDAAEASLVLAHMAIEHLHGECATRLDAGHAWDGIHRQCVIDASNQIGLELNRLFVGFLKREFGPDAFRVERVTKAPKPARG